MMRIRWLLSFILPATLFTPVASSEIATSDRGTLQHHTRDGYRNPHNSPMAGFSGLLKWQLGLGPTEHVLIPDSAVPPYIPATVVPDYGRIYHPDTAAIQVTWIGHSSFLIQLHGLNILTDPVFSDRVSPVSFAGPQRLAPPGIPFDKLPAIDLVLISHNHYDHLDDSTIRRLGNHPTYFVPLGIKSWLAERGITNVEEYDWWQTGQVHGLQIHCVPSQHFSGRSLTDRNKTLWCGWFIASGQTKVHFVGDTGYSRDFKDVFERYGASDLALIPIGAYRPRWFMSPVHVDPFQAVQIHRDLHAQHSIGTHWGTFKLSDEPSGAPPVELELAATRAHLASHDFTVMKFGETRAF